MLVTSRWAVGNGRQIRFWRECLRCWLNNYKQKCN